MRVRVDLAERDGRALHVLDIENLGRGPQCNAPWLLHALGRFQRAAEWTRLDHAVGAASTFMYKRVCFDLPASLRFLPAGGGPDAADRRLLDEVNPEWTAEHFGRVVIGSGDHAFAPLAWELRYHGVETWAVCWRTSLHPDLAAAVDHVRFLDEAGPLEDSSFVIAA